MYIDEKLIKEELNISVDQLKRESIGTAIELEKKAKKKKIAEKMATNKKDSEYSDFVRTFFEPYKMLRKYFSDKEIINACIRNNVGKENLAEKYYCRTNYCPYDTNIYIGEEWKEMKKLSGVGSRSGATENVLCSVFWIKERYQGIVHGKVINSLMLKKHKELKKFSFAFYEYTDYGAPYEGYVKTSDGVLYVPFDALMTGNWDAIQERNVSYFKSYYHTDQDPVNISTKEAKELKSIIETWKE